VDQLPTFGDALAQLRCLLGEHGLPTDVAWVFREDWYSTGPSSHRVIWPLPRENEDHARCLYDSGGDRGLVELQAVFFVDESSVVNVFAPDTHEIQGWNRGLRLSIRQPFTSAGAVRAAGLWRWHRITPGYRRFQRLEPFVSQRRDVVLQGLSSKRLEPTGLSGALTREAGRAGGSSAKR
jgi:hypothetical protein